VNPRTLVLIRVLIYTVVSLSIAWNTVMSDVIWDSMTWEQQSCVVFGILSLWGTTMGAYVDKSMWKYNESKNSKANDL